jgi:5'-methylthioadenosine nucleosidase
MALTEIQPDLVINAGTAGGFRKRTAEIGDVFLSTSIKHHDRRIPIPGFVEYGRGNHQAHFPENLIKAHGYKSGIITTSNSLDHTEMDDIIMEENQASVKEMEAASIAWVVEQFQVPFFAVKVITDIGNIFSFFSVLTANSVLISFFFPLSFFLPIVDGDRPTNEEFLENLHSASKSLQLNLPKIVEFCMGKKLSEL